MPDPTDPAPGDRRRSTPTGSEPSTPTGSTPSTAADDIPTPTGRARSGPGDSESSMVTDGRPAGAADHETRLPADRGLSVLSDNDPPFPFEHGLGGTPAGHTHEPGFDPGDPVPNPAESLVALVKPRMRGWIHTWAAAVAAVAVIALVAAATTVSATAVVATAVYGVTICALFGISATYHRITWTTVRARIRMKRADHSMIFLFIAGTYTPFALLGLPEPTGSILLAVVWSGALAGVALKVLWPQAPRWVGVPLYLLLGWAVVPVGGELYRSVGLPAVLLLVAGGLAYSGGAILYATRWPNPWPGIFGHHEFFHAATVLAALCHYIAVWLVLLD